MSAVKARSAALAALLVGAALLLGGCGGGDSSESTPASASPVPQGPKTKPDTTESGSPKQGPSAVEPSPASKPQQAQGAASSQSQGTKHGKHAVLPEGNPEPAPSPTQRAQATVADIVLTSPSLGAPGSEGAATLPARYTCQGANTWPTLKWNGAPAGTQELILLALAQEPVNEALFFNWAVAGIDPATTEIESGKLPSGAVVGQNSFGKAGYSVCPTQGPETFVFALYALPARLSASKGFDPAALREKVLEASGNVGLLAAVGG